MKVVLALMMASIAAAVPADSYSSKYDTVDIDEILKNDRLFKKYNDCLANAGKCTPEGKELKDHLAEAIKTDCKKCNPAQKNNLIKFLKQTMKDRPSSYKSLEKIYDPEHIFRKKYSS